MIRNADAMLPRALRHAERGEVLQAEFLYLGALELNPGCADAARSLAARREDWQRALHDHQIAIGANRGFSVMRAKSKIMPHLRVTSSRLVMHLPLVVPPDCALNIDGARGS